MSILLLISPLIVVIFLGYVSAKSQWLTATTVQGLSKLTFQLFIPAFLFKQMATAHFPEHVNADFFGAFYLPVLLCFSIAWLIRYYYTTPTNEHLNAASAVYALAASYSNTVIIGLPIVLMMQGQQALVLVFLIVTFHSALLFSLTSVLAAKQQHFSWSSLLNNTVNNPLIISISLGALVNVIGIVIPHWLLSSLTLLSSPAIALALYILGASLTNYQLTEAKRFVIIATLLKLMLLPAMVWFAAHHVFHLSTSTTQVLVILSACPTGVNAYLTAANLKAQQQTVASTVLLSTVMSVFSLPLWLYWLS